MIAWSIVAAAQAALSGKGSFYACRALIGMLEGGFIPDLVLWYVLRSEVSIDLSMNSYLHNCCQAVVFLHKQGIADSTLLLLDCSGWHSDHYLHIGVRPPAHERHSRNGWLEMVLVTPVH